MSCRHLTISLERTGDVSYSYFRHHSRYMLSKYLVEYPAEKVCVKGGPNLTGHGYRQCVTPEGYLLLEWDLVPEAETGQGRGVDYVKRGLLDLIQKNPPLWRYRDTVKIKGGVSGSTFELRLHRPSDCLSAVKAESRAVFTMETDGRLVTTGYCRGFLGRKELGNRWQAGGVGSVIALTPSQLSQVVFHCSGILQVDWVLEVT